MERILGGVKKTAHEVALSDLIGAAMISGTCPARRALVAVQPRMVALGLEPTPPVAAAIPEMVAAVLAILERWRGEPQAK
jgi:hydrogenase maturation protease